MLISVQLEGLLGFRAGSVWCVDSSKVSSFWMVYCCLLGLCWHCAVVCQFIRVLKCQRSVFDCWLIVASIDCVWSQNALFFRLLSRKFYTSRRLFVCLSTAACIFTVEAYHRIVHHKFACSMAHPVSFCTVNVLSVLHIYVHKVGIIWIVPHCKNKVDPPTTVDCHYVDYCVSLCHTEHWSLFHGTCEESTH